MATTLAPLKVEGWQTADVESLCGYVQALAKSHRVLVSAMVRFLWNEHRRGRGWRAASHMSTMDGYGEYAQRFSESIGALGRRVGVYLCTCLPWKDCFDPRGHALHKPNRAWCGACFLQDLAAGRRPYIRLHWGLAPVAACVVHRTRLSGRCHICGKEQSHLPRLPFCDRCGKCGALLHDPSTTLATAQELLDARNTYELLSVSHLEGGQTIGRDQAARLVKAVADQVCNGSVRALETATGLHGLRKVAAGKCRFTFTQFIRFCGVVGCSAAALVTGFHSCTGVVQARTEAVPLRNLKKRPEDDHQQLRSLVAKLARERNPPLALREIARRLERSVSVIRHRYPDLVTGIAHRYLEHRARQNAAMNAERARRVELAIAKCRGAGCFPSDRHLRSHGGLISSDLVHRVSRPLILEARRRQRIGL